MPDVARRSYEATMKVIDYYKTKESFNRLEVIVVSNKTPKVDYKTDG